ncbi:MAG TPA: DUF4105 domain-containing protein [Gemmatimonadaceae bacterium]|nr:DUF4105 domain-containing protein [Gemmatimonadaceae bacterium]
MKRSHLVAGGALVVAAIGGIVAWRSIRPSDDRNWIPEHRVLAEARIEGSRVDVRNVRSFNYTARSAFTPEYADRTYDLDKLQSVWYVLSPFSEGWRGPAHSFVSFGFADSQFVSISVEARREVGETYSVLNGLFKRYEVMYVVGDESDLIAQRAAYGTDRVYLYPVRTSPEKMRAMFLSMIRRANGLRERPEFYNTATNNCTSNVIAHVNDVTPKTVSAGIRTILPGYSDEVAMQLGLIDTDLDLAAARERFLINARARAFANDPAFSWKIRGM